MGSSTSIGVASLPSFANNGHIVGSSTSFAKNGQTPWMEWMYSAAVVVMDGRMDAHLKHLALKRRPLWLLPVMGCTMANGAAAQA